MPPPFKGKYLHKKTGHLYVVEGIVLNSTNSADDVPMVLYHCLDDSVNNTIDPAIGFVRELPEFLEKFVKV